MRPRRAAGEQGPLKARPWAIFLKRGARRAKDKHPQMKKSLGGLGGQSSPDAHRGEPHNTRRSAAAVTGSRALFFVEHLQFPAGTDNQT